jgi:hypothetical protein
MWFHLLHILGFQYFTYKLEFKPSFLLKLLIWGLHAENKGKSKLSSVADWFCKAQLLPFSGRQDETSQEKSVGGDGAQSHPKEETH